MKKAWILTVLGAVCALCFTACASSADTMPIPGPSVSASPMASPMASPSVTITTAPTASAAPVATVGISTVEDALKASERIAEEAEKLSELDEAVAVAAGNIALIGISYDTQYQGGLTERINEMVSSRVENVDRSLSTVHVTDDEKQTRQIEQLYEQLRGGQLSFSELQTQVLEIGSTLTGGGSSSGEELTQPQDTTGA